MSKVPDRARPTITSRIGVSLPTAVGALLFAGAIAFGSGMVDAIAPLSGDSQTAQEDADKPQDGGGDYSDKPALDEDDIQQPNHDQPDKPQSEPTPKPEPKPEPPKPEPAPPATVGELGLEAFSFDGKVKLSWSVFGGDGFAFYKLVRSSDATVSWPLGSGDALAAYASDRTDTFFKDFPTCGTEWHYRVFAVMGGDTGYATLAASNVASAVVECVDKPSPPPVYEMGFGAEVIDGQVHLSWEQCTSEGFAAYKIVRSQTNENPKYPLNEGTELIAAIGDASVTAFVDGAVSSGQTWHYRVLSMANDGWGWYPIGMTPVLTVTIP